MNSDYCVTLIVDRFYGDKLGDLQVGKPVWIVDSTVNYPVIRDLWKQRGTLTHLTGITSFNDVPDNSPEDLAISMLDTIEEHHGFYSHKPPWNVLRIIGAEKTEPLVAALNTLGFQPVAGSGTDFEYRKNR
jgi:hypothetical protein